MSDKTAMPEPLSTLDVNLLVKIAAIVYDDDLIDRDLTDYRAVNLMRRCSEALAAGHLVQVAIPGDALIRGLVGEDES